MTRREEELCARAAALQGIVAELEEREADALADARYDLRSRARHVKPGVFNLHRPPTVSGRPPRTLQWTTNDPMERRREPVAVARLLRWDRQANVARYTLITTPTAREIGALLALGLEPTVRFTRNERTGAIGVELAFDTPHTGPEEP